jgi:hypothetical protein
MFRTANPAAAVAAIAAAGPSIGAIVDINGPNLAKNPPIFVIMPAIFGKCVTTFKIRPIFFNFNNIFKCFKFPNHFKCLKNLAPKNEVKIVGNQFLSQPP